ncbi:MULTISPECIES: hypothetical protein [unclassified Streptomyces]|uniref:hypothetical protein n=1 Tax=unclassified Streptomyces TaxID=2593676 RepID=UPI0003748078|nr:MULTISPECIES: hypothetical protein [unclassified Streptomyces]MYX39030.1 hypothetical protein [Streptomyces sp. SID8377]
MPVEPVPCQTGGGDTPVEVTTCCAPSIASAALCRADGSTVLLVVRSGCVECGEAAPDPEVAGWIDAATGAFTAGPPPADAGPCDAGCVDTVCRQLCDDTDGDGQADATYSELWCIRADGSAELVLTYQVDPSVPYVPVAPVECAYGCPESETVTLCDDSGPFLRRYSFLNGTATYEDVALDGQTPHVVTGTVGVCGPDTSSDCVTVCRQLCDDTDGDGQPDATYSELWCVHADGTAELVLTYQDDPSVPYTPVAPVDCEYANETTEVLTLCDDTGPFLRRYSWLGDTASFEDVELDGVTPHVVTGTVGVCAAQTECEAATTPAATLGLCLADGTPIAVLVTRDCTGTTTQDGWLNLTTGAYSAGSPPAGTMACGNPRSITTAGTFCDVDPSTGDVLGLVLIEYTYGADGAVTAVRLVDATTGQTYVPQGEVTTCPAGVEQPERDLVQLCDTAADGTVTEFVRDYARDENGAITGHTDYLLDGAPYTPAGTVGRCVDQCQDCETVVLCDADANEPATVAGTASSGTLPNGVAWSATGPAPFAPNRQSDGAAWWGVGLFPNQVVPVTTWTFSRPVTVDFSVALVYVAGTTGGENTVQLPPGAIPISLPPGYTYDPATRILRGDATLTGCTINAPTRAASARFRVIGVSSFALQYLGPRVLVPACQRFGNWQFGALDVSLGGQFLRTVCRDCTGATTSVTDTLLDGSTPYTPVGLVGVCPPGDDGEGCTNGTTVLLCDQPAGGSGPVTAAITDATSADVGQTQFTNLPGSYTSLWSGGSLVYPAGTGPNQEHAQATGRITAVAPAGCETSGGTLTVSVRVTQNGPGTGQAWDGALRLFRGTTLLDFDDALTYAPPGWTKTLTVSAPVTAADLTSGNLFVGLPLETFHGTAKHWTADQFEATVQLTDCASSESVQFLRTIVTDCETGAVVATSDTTLDGDPYTVTGDVGQCAAAGGDEEECCESGSTLTLCDVADDGTSTPFLRRLTYTPGIATPTVADFALDGITPYTVAGTVGVCAPEAEPCRNSNSLLLCDLPTDGDPAPTVTDTPGGPYYPYTTGVAMPGAQTLWDGGTLVFPDAAGPQPGTGGTVRTAAAVIQAPRPACDTGTAHVTVQVDVTQLGPDNGCRNSGFLGLYNGPGDANRVALALAPLDTPAGWSGTLTAEADVPAADLAAGNIAVLVAFDAYDDSGATCPPPRRTAWQLSAFTATTAYDQTGCDTQFLRTVTVDCETGAVTAVVDTTMDGQPYTPTGQPGQCSATGGACCPEQPCGDTEVVQLCDLTYDPQAPIPTPAGDFTLTGNVVAANNGTTLWFAQANQVANGVAELLVSGLLPATLYEFRFASAWIGAGGSDPVGNAAIYRLDILDGATLLATRTRNVSNGSNVFPGGVLTEDLPPLAFIAPATGAVTIRFTDQTTGGAVNDRDLFLMPLEVRTAALTVTRTPFLRRFTYDCDGALTSTQDLGLDGTTPYVVEGEASNCAGDSTAAGSVTPCDVQNVVQACRCDDTDGDGLADTDYLELLGVDCDGQLTSLGTYLPDLSAPYTPVAPVDCGQVDEGADPAVGVQAHRIELNAEASWDAASVAALQSVTAVAHGGTGTITTVDGASTLHTGEAATWSVARTEDAALTGPLTITANSGTVTVTWTQGVTL